MFFCLRFLCPYDVRMMSYDVRMHEPGARVSSADAEGLARV